MEEQILEQERLYEQEHLLEQMTMVQRIEQMHMERYSHFFPAACYRREAYEQI